MVATGNDTEAPANVSKPEKRPRSARRAQRGSLRLLVVDLIIAISLFAAAAPIRWMYTRGDLWLDEADYAFAAIRGFESNRWDTPDTPSEPDKLIRLRHYHPPLIAHVTGLALRRAPDDRTLRLPAVAAGCLTVSLLYLCGVSLFTQSWLSKPPKSGSRSRNLNVDITARAIAVACAVVLIFTPAHVRASSHALPWAFIALWLLALVWTMLKLAQSDSAAWLLGTGAILGALFGTSEYAVPAAIAVVLALPFAGWQLARKPEGRRALALGIAGGTLLFFAVSYTLWPAGLYGGMFRMLKHYADMANDPWPVRVHGVAYARAPKTAYLIWYWEMYKPYLGFYTLGAIGSLILALASRGRRGVAALLVFEGVVLGTAHRSHIIGPEYLVHALPLLTLAGGLFFVLVSRIHWVVGALSSVGAGGFVSAYHDPSGLSGMDARSRNSRWPEAAHAIAARWKPTDRMLAPAYGSAGRWYVLHVAGVKAKEWQVQGLPTANERTSQSMMKDLKRGVYRIVAVGSTFSDYANVDSRVSGELARWKIVFKSNESGGGPSRLIVYERPSARDNADRAEDGG